MDNEDNEDIKVGMDASRACANILNELDDLIWDEAERLVISEGRDRITDIDVMRAFQYIKDHINEKL